MRRTFPLLAILVAVLAACGARPTSTTTGQPTTTATVTPGPLQQGIDVSWHSGEIDWPAVRAAGHTFSYIKATEGDDLADPAFEQHWRAAGAAGVRRGAYHFYVTEDDPRDQAEFFISKVRLAPGDLAPVVDIELIGEKTKPGLADRLRIWLEIVEGHYGVRPMIYTSPNFWNAHVGEGFGHYPLWIADYDVDEPVLPVGWNAWHLWQWRDNADVPGVEKGADMSRINHRVENLDVLLVRDPLAQ